VIKTILKKKLSKFFIYLNNDKGLFESIITNLNRFVYRKEQLQHFFLILIGYN
jgi:hypothetical protein